MNLNNIYTNIDFKNILDTIRAYDGPNLNIMEVCGTHTSVIYKNRIDSLMPANIKLISGPGCPVCVTSEEYIDIAIELSNLENTILLTFGDLLKVNGSKSNLYSEKSKGKDIRIICSPLDAIPISKENQDKEVIVLAVGFETTIATYSILVDEVLNQNITNISFLNSLKTIPWTLKNIFNDDRVNIQGLIAPGHVASIIGSIPFDILSTEFKKPSVICGFNGEDIIIGIYSLIKMIGASDNSCKNLYKHGVKQHGNIKAQRLIEKYFIESDGDFRGIGVLRNSGYELKSEFSRFDTLNKFKLNIKKNNFKSACECADIILGIKNPVSCKLFSVKCTPQNPIGPCMVSSEGTCANYYKYKGNCI